MSEDYTEEFEYAIRLSNFEVTFSSGGNLLMNINPAGSTILW